MTDWRERLLGYKSQAERERREAEEEARRREEQKARERAEAERKRGAAMEALNREARNCLDRLGVTEKLKFVRDRLWEVGSEGKIQFSAIGPEGSIYDMKAPGYVLSFCYPHVREIEVWIGGGYCEGDQAHWSGTGRYEIYTCCNNLRVIYKAPSCFKQDGDPYLFVEEEVSFQPFSTRTFPLSQGDLEARLSEILGETFRVRVLSNRTPLALREKAREAIQEHKRMRRL